MPIAGGGGGVWDDPKEATPRVLAAVTAALERLVERNEGIAAAEAAVEQGEEVVAVPVAAPLDGFRGVRAPGIGVGRYLERIYRYTRCSPSCFVVGFAYVDRLAHRHPSSLVVSVNVHRLVLASVLVASKVLDDVHHNNAFYAKVGGVSNAELNRMELELLFLLDFGVTVSSHVFESYCNHLEKELLCSGAGVAPLRGLEENQLADGGGGGGGSGSGDDAQALAVAESGEHDAPRSLASSSSPRHSF